MNWEKSSPECRCRNRGLRIGYIAILHRIFLHHQITAATGSGIQIAVERFNGDLAAVVTGDARPIDVDVSAGVNGYGTRAGGENAARAQCRDSEVFRSHIQLRGRIYHIETVIIFNLNSDVHLNGPAVQ